MKKRVYLLLCLTFFVIFSLVGCGNKETTPELTQEILEEICSNAIKQDIYFDQISNMTFTEVETSEDDLNTLKEVFASQVPYKTIKCTANISSISMDAYIEYNLVCAFNVEWKVVSCYSVNEGNWEYDAKKFVSLKEIMNDLKGVKVGLFEAGYCGNEKNSTLVINSREEDENINRETVYCTLTIDTDFGYYEVDIEAIYYFKKGNWIIGDFVIPEVHDWKFTFDKGFEIKLFNEEYIENKLTTKTEFLTYIVNKDNVDSSAIYLEGMQADTEFVTYNYVYSVSYKDIGIVTYNVDVSYEWLFLEWGEGQFKISVKDNKFGDLKNTKYTFGDKYILIKDVVDYDKDLVPEGTKISEASQFVTFEYFNGENKYEIFSNILVVLRDNRYDFTILKITRDGQEVKRFTDFEKITLDISNKSLIANETFLNDPTYVYTEEVEKEEVEKEEVEKEEVVVNSNYIGFTFIETDKEDLEIETFSIKKDATDGNYYLFDKKENLNHEILFDEKYIISEEDYKAIMDVVNSLDWNSFKDYKEAIPETENETGFEYGNSVVLENADGSTLTALWEEVAPEKWMEYSISVKMKTLEISNKNIN